jgi:hypothetical protein
VPRTVSSASLLPPPHQCRTVLCTFISVHVLCCAVAVAVTAVAAALASSVVAMAGVQDLSPITDRIKERGGITHVRHRIRWVAGGWCSSCGPLIRVRHDA